MKKAVGLIRIFIASPDSLVSISKSTPKAFAPIFKKEKVSSLLSFNRFESAAKYSISGLLLAASIPLFSAYTVPDGESLERPEPLQLPHVEEVNCFNPLIIFSVVTCPFALQVLQPMSPFTIFTGCENLVLTTWLSENLTVNSSKYSHAPLIKLSLYCSLPFGVFVNIPAIKTTGKILVPSIPES